MQNHTFTSASEDETIKIASDFAAQLSNPAIICLHGTLGAGKSVFARALVRALCDDHDLEVPSPTFTLVQSYDGVNYPVFHFDLYRIKDPDELYELGWEDTLDDCITIIEWPERLGYLKPPKVLDITITPADNEPSSRTIEIKGI